MKKSQILAALALAFALGVVIPVSGVANALTLEVVEDGVVTTVGKASLAEATAAAKYATADTKYSNLLKFQAAALAALQAKGDSFTVAGTDETSVIWANADEAAKMVQAIKTAYETAMGAAVVPAGLNSDAAALAAWQTPEGKKYTISPAMVKDVMIAKIESETKVKAFYGVYDAVVNKKSATAFASAAEFLKNNVAAYAALSTNEDAYNAVKNNTAYAGVPAGFMADYNNFVKLFEAIDQAKTEINGYNAQYKAVDAAYKTLLAAGQITAAGKTAYTQATTKYYDHATSDFTANDTKWPQIAQLIGVVWDYAHITSLEDGSFFKNGNVYEATEWNTVAAKINDVEALDSHSSEAQIYDAIEALATAFIAATREDISVNNMIKKMVAYKAPAGDTDTDKPGDDQNADADAPNTGALLSSDKGATTVSIVAGLATALTALGAGVVAYRNARRSSK